MSKTIPENMSGQSSNNFVPDHAVAAAPAEMPTAGAYEDQKNNGNRKTDESIGGAEKGGAGYSAAQHRLPPDSDGYLKITHDSNSEGSPDVIQIEEDRSK